MPDIVKKIMMRFLLLGLIFLYAPGLIAQGEIPSDFADLYRSGDFKGALKLISRKLDELYSARSGDKRIPVSFFSMERSESEVNLLKMFREKKVNPFFIEENPEFYTLHSYAGHCHREMREYDKAVSHFINALRYREALSREDAVIFHGMYLVFSSAGRKTAAERALEKAYSLDPLEARYSLELGLLLYGTGDRKKAVFHLERYIQAADEDIEPGLYLKLAGLYESLDRALDTERCYRKYLALKPDDYFVLFASAVLAAERTGNTAFASESISALMPLLPADDLYRNSKAREIYGDIALRSLDYRGAVKAYGEALAVQEKHLAKIVSARESIAALSAEIGRLKSALLSEEKFDDFQEYELKENRRAQLQLELKRLEAEYRDLNPGKIRWSMAVAHEKNSSPEEAIKYYREALSYNYKSAEARDNIAKLQLKIKRGY